MALSYRFICTIVNCFVMNSTKAIGHILCSVLWRSKLLWTKQRKEEEWWVWRRCLKILWAGEGAGNLDGSWEVERLGLNISDDSTSSCRRWPVEETTHLCSDTGASFWSNKSLLMSATTQTPVHSRCRVADIHAQTSADCCQALCTNIRVQCLGGHTLLTILSFLFGILLILYCTAANDNVNAKPCTHVLSVPLLENICCIDWSQTAASLLV